MLKTIVKAIYDYCVQIAIRLLPLLGIWIKEREDSGESNSCLKQKIVVNKDKSPP